MKRFPFDSVILPFNYPMHLNDRYRAEFEEVVRICRERNTSVQVIKSLARGPWGMAPQNLNTWYQPLEEQGDIDRAVHWVMGRCPDAFISTVGDIDLWPTVLDAASRFTEGPAAEEMDDMLKRQGMSSPFGIGT